MVSWLTLVVATSYLVAATLFLLGLQRMSSPVTARSGIQWAGIGMVIATVATFLLPGLHNMALIVIALVLGTVLAWVWGKKVAITDMPQMVALFNGMLCKPGSRNVATVAITMPTPAHWMPLRAVTGEDMRCRPRRNSVAATK